jgi:hypothetical protein
MIVAFRRVLGVILFGVLPLAFSVAVLRSEAHLGLLGFDFKGTIWEPGRAILHGHSPYPHPTVSEMQTGNPSVYPPVGLWLALPFAALPFAIAYWMWTALLVAAIVATLAILQIRDWRCYTLALSSCPVVFGLALGNVVTLLLPLAALVWERRRSPWASGIALGLAIAIKLVFWPLLFWMVATNRMRTAAVSVGTAAVSTLVAWAAIGFAGFASYPHLLEVNTNLYATHSWSLYAGSVGLGFSHSVANALMWIVGAAVLGASVAVARRGGDREGFCGAIFASLALLPIVWVHSLVVLLLPLAVGARALNRQWLLFAALWLAAFAPHTLAHIDKAPAGIPLSVWTMHHSPPPIAQIGVFVLVVGVMTVASLRLRIGRRGISEPMLGAADRPARA